MSVESCDRCGKVLGEQDFRATHKDGRELMLCYVHERDHRDALGKQRFTIEPYVPPTQTGSVNDVMCPGCKKFIPGVQLKIGAGPWVRVVVCRDCDTRVRQ